MTSAAAGTIVAKNKLSLARVVAESFRRHHPDIPFFVLLADEVDGYFDPTAEPFHLVGMHELEIPRPGAFRFHVPQQPLSYAATPYFVSHLLRKGFRRVLFIKQESLVTGSLQALLLQLERSPIVLTPHLLSPLEGVEGAERELNTLQSGVFNIGIFGVTDEPVARAFLQWWERRVFGYCRHAIADGMHYEQRWADLVPAYFPGTFVFRDPRYNIAHWNLPERKGYIVDGSARLVRFSGFDPDEPEWVTRYNRRLRVVDLGAASSIYRSYARLLDEAGLAETRRWPYAWESFDDGVPIPDIARELFSELGEKADEQGDPFQTKHRPSFRDWLNEGVDGGEPVVSRLWHAVWRRRNDLIRAFPDPLGEHREAFIAWTRTSGVAEHGIHDVFMRGATV